MNLINIFAYFVEEALVSLWRSWKVSLLAILTIAMSISIGGTFLLLSGNLDRVVESWRQEAKIIIYLAAEATSEDRERIRPVLESPVWVTAVDEVSGTDAAERFRETFPSLEELLDSWGDQPLPTSFEVGFDANRIDEGDFQRWLAGLREDSTVVMVDDDRDWLRQLDAFVAVLRGLGFVVGIALLGAAIVTIGSVIRLTAFLYRDEIAVMRLVGATELYIRGPFYFEGLIQGFLGGVLAIFGLYVGYIGLHPERSTLLLGTVLIEDFLPWSTILGLIVLATLAGCAGAILSLRRETLAAD